jgi:hypothetical protein
MKNGGDKSKQQPPFIILREQRRTEVQREPLRLLSSRPEKEEPLLPEPLSFGYTSFGSCHFMEEDVQCELMKKIPSPSQSILINYLEFE